MYFTHIRTYISNTIRTRFVIWSSHPNLVDKSTCSSFPCFGSCRSFMSISLKRAQSLWRLGEPWTWHILSNGSQPISVLLVALKFTWITHFLSIRWRTGDYLDNIVFLILFICSNDWHLISTMRFNFSFLCVACNCVMHCADSLVLHL